MLLYQVRERSWGFLKFNIQGLLKHCFNSGTSSCLLLQHLCIQVHRRYTVSSDDKAQVSCLRLGEVYVHNQGIKERTQCSNHSIFFKPLFLFSFSDSTPIFHDMCVPTLEYTRKIVKNSIFKKFKNLFII